MYAHQDIEQKWQDFWKKNNVFKTHNPHQSHTKPHPNPLLKERGQAPKYYVLDMFPYPSGAGLHVGHPEGYTANDIVARYKHARGYNVLHPMGWDAFGLPAENYAIKTGVHPKITTAENIATFKRQIQSLGFSYDWSREIDTTDPKYFQWTQWIFLKLFEAGLAYEQDLPINYCPSCKTGLANEEVLSDFSCERCGTKVEKKKIRQWVLAITKYAERLLADVDDLDWPEGIKDMQRNWIGKSEGCEFEMKVVCPHPNPAHSTPHPNPLLPGEGTDTVGQDVVSSPLAGENGERCLAEIGSIRVYTTRVDTVFGMTYAVIAPDHPQVMDFITDEQRTACESYIKTASQQSDQDRTADDKEKTGVFTGSYVINPYNGEQVPLWIADYVLGSYGTGAVMAVPAHDERDFAFAKKFGLKIRPVIAEYNILTGENAPKEGIFTREKICSTVIIEHSEEKKYLVQNFENGELGFTGGGVEKNENPQEAAIRELKEESGLENIKEIYLSSIMVGHGYKPRKEMNCKDPDYVFFIKLANLDGFQENCFENVNYKNEWYTQEQILENPTFKSHHKKQFQDFLKGPHATTSYGILMDSGEFTGLTSSEARTELTAFAEKNGFGYKKINYKLRDWLFSRQRYWGEPIPLIHLESSDVEKLPTISSLEEAKDEKRAYVLHVKPHHNSSPQGEDEATDTSKIEAPLSSEERGFRSEVLGEKNQNGEKCCVEKYLVLNGKVFSKIYDGIYGKIVCDYRLPLELPQVEAYEPAGDGQSPLAKVPEFVNVQLAENLSGKRETNTMPQWGGSCWYYLRFMDAKNPEELVSKAAENYWGSVDSYVGGAEHAVLHLLYARFWHKFLYDIGVVSTIEPFHRLRNQGMILAYAYQRSNGGLLANDLVEERSSSQPSPKGEGVAPKFYEISTGEEVKRVVAKMSKSLKNVVNPDDIVKQFGADTLRLYEMYMGDFADTKPWDTTAIVGCRRFLDRVHALFIDGKEKFAETDEKAMKTLHKAIKKITEDIENYKFNTAIAQMMICINEGLPQDAAKKQEWKESFLKLLHPFAPHLAEECWENLSPHPTSPYQGEEQAAVLPLLTKEGIRGGKIYFATGNIAKVERLQKIVGTDINIVAYNELIDVEETGKTALECALQKLAVYERKKLDAPILTADTSVHFEGQDFDPTRVRRAALEKAGKKESELSREEIGLLMRDFYQDIARKAGGKIAFHYTDAFAILYPDGSKKTYEYTRPYYLTDTIFGELNPNIPMRSLYISQITGKTPYNTTDEDYEKEFAAQKDMAIELFGLGKNSIFFTQWPSYDEALTVDSELTIGVQVLGKLRGEVHVSVDELQDSVLAKAKANPDVAKWLEGKQIVKEIYVPGKIVNIVVK